MPSETSTTSEKSTEPGLDQIGQNIESIARFYLHEERKLGSSQRLLEYLSDFLVKPLYLGLVMLFVSLWILFNMFAGPIGLRSMDPAPYFWLQGIIGLGTLITSTVVLIAQSRLAKLEERRTHLDLQVNLLTEQKVTKIIDLLEELRRDLPMVKDRVDAEVVALQQPTDPHVVLAALDEQREAGKQAIAPVSS